MSNPRALRVGAGVAVLLGLAAGVALLVLSARALEQTVRGFARAPVGCTTTLQFDRAATFTLYLETKGSVGDLGGDCAANGTTYDYGAGTPPPVTITLVDASGAAVPLDAAPQRTYDTGSFVGTALQQVTVVPGAYDITVASDSTEVAVAVGRNPEADSSVLQSAAAAVALLGVVIGVVLMLVGRRHASTPPPPSNPDDEQWRPRLPVDPWAAAGAPPPPRPTLGSWAPPPAPTPAQSQPQPPAPPGWGPPQP